MVLVELFLFLEYFLRGGGGLCKIRHQRRFSIYYGPIEKFTPGTKIARRTTLGIDHIYNILKGQILICKTGGDFWFVLTYN